MISCSPLRLKEVKTITRTQRTGQEKPLPAALYTLEVLSLQWTSSSYSQLRGRQCGRFWGAAAEELPHRSKQ